jgi:hypothetical protein
MITTLLILILLAILAPYFTGYILGLLFWLTVGAIATILVLALAAGIFALIPDVVVEVVSDLLALGAKFLGLLFVSYVLVYAPLRGLYDFVMGFKNGYNNTSPSEQDKHRTEQARLWKDN